MLVKFKFVDPHGRDLALNLEPATLIADCKQRIISDPHSMQFGKEEDITLYIDGNYKVVELQDHKILGDVYVNSDALIFVVNRKRFPIAAISPHRSASEALFALWYKLFVGGPLTYAGVEPLTSVVVFKRKMIMIHQLWTRGCGSTDDISICFGSNMEVELQDDQFLEDVYSNSSEVLFVVKKPRAADSDGAAGRDCSSLWCCWNV